MFRENHGENIFGLRITETKIYLFFLFLCFIVIFLEALLSLLEIQIFGFIDIPYFVQLQIGKYLHESTLNFDGTHYIKHPKSNCEFTLDWIILLAKKTQYYVFKRLVLMKVLNFGIIIPVFIFIIVKSLLNKNFIFKYIHKIL